MNNRILFANSLNDLGVHGNLSANECERFGMAWGCKPDCPVFERGDCKDCYFQNIEMFIIHNEIDKSEAESIIDTYSSKLSDSERDKLSVLLNAL